MKLIGVVVVAHQRSATGAVGIKNGNLTVLVVANQRLINRQILRARVVDTRLAVANDNRFFNQNRPHVRLDKNTVPGVVDHHHLSHDDVDHVGVGPQPFGQVPNRLVLFNQDVVGQKELQTGRVPADPAVGITKPVVPIGGAAGNNDVFTGFDGHPFAAVIIRFRTINAHVGAFFKQQPGIDILRKATVLNQEVGHLGEQHRVPDAGGRLFKIKVFDDQVRHPLGVEQTTQGVLTRIVEETARLGDLDCGLV